jgi:hypothetical protein
VVVGGGIRIFRASTDILSWSTFINRNIRDSPSYSQSRPGTAASLGGGSSESTAPGAGAGGHDDNNGAAAAAAAIYGMGMS